ncbi:MAG: ATP-binding protein [Chloroflexi bacterium]|nr:ATP-binding protein [Chloroflexota bacterium]
MTTKKLVPLLIALLGLALVIAAFVVWFEPPAEGGVFSTAGAIISFLLGAGASLKGWKDFFKKDEPATSTQHQTQSQDQNQTQSQVVHIHNYPPASQLPLTNHQPLTNTLPHQPYFFGRAAELDIIKSALSPDSRTWGALIDGPGGIGKTALAIKAAHDAPAELFERKIFITAKVRELTAEGEAKLTDFTRPTYLAMLDELGKELGADGLEKLAPDERPDELRLALAGVKALIIFDNLETLPEGNKAIVTSRRRTDVDARIVRLDRLARDEALQLIAELAAKYPRLPKRARRPVRDHAGQPALHPLDRGTVGARRLAVPHHRRSLRLH